MPLFKIYAGLGGDFGGADFIEEMEFDSEIEASQCAWEKACEIYESYYGLHGLRTISQIIEEDLSGDEYSECSENELEEIAEEIYSEERESWLDYYVILTDSQEQDEND